MQVVDANRPPEIAVEARHRAKTQTRIQRAVIHRDSRISLITLADMSHRHARHAIEDARQFGAEINSQSRREDIVRVN